MKIVHTFLAWHCALQYIHSIQMVFLINTIGTIPIFFDIIFIFIKQTKIFMNGNKIISGYIMWVRGTT